MISFVEIERIVDEENGRTSRITMGTVEGKPLYRAQMLHNDSWITLSGDHSIAKSRERLEDHNGHAIDLKRLNRSHQRPLLSRGSPWGPIHTETVYAPGIIAVTTAQHGGFLLDPAANEAVHPALRNAGGIYEEDSEWAKVAFTYPDLFTPFERKIARSLLMNEEPDGWTAATGESLAVEDSQTLRERRFYAEHRKNWIVISCGREVDGRHVATAVQGGYPARQSNHNCKTRSFSVPVEEYANRPEFGFVIDETRHPEVTD